MTPELPDEQLAGGEGSKENGDVEPAASQQPDQISLLSQSSATNVLIVVDDAFARSFLDAHNRFRKLHGAPDLHLSEPLCVQAQQWAQRIARKRHMSYCELAGIGECITFFPINLRAEEIVAYWYDEHRKYEYETPGWQAGTNYFTQIVWCSTTELGVGRAPVRPIIEPMNRRVDHSTQSSEPSPTADSRRFSTTESVGGAMIAATRQSRQCNSARSSTYFEYEEQVVVAFYRPAGNSNRAGQFALNVFKPLSGADC